MENLKVCICDDDGELLTAYSSAVKGCFKGIGIHAEVDTYTSASNLGARLASISYDIIFLDIDMPGEDGVTFAKRLRKHKNNVPIIFVTAREDRMFDTFSVQPFAFVRKSKLIFDLNEAARLFIEARPEFAVDNIIFSTHLGGYQVNAKQIIYIESYLHTQYVYLDGQPKLTINSRMESVHDLLAEKGFIRVHKGYIVNYRYIKRIENTEIQLVTGQSVPLSRSKKKEVMSLWLEFGVKNGFVYLGSQ